MRGFWWILWDLLQVHFWGGTHPLGCVGRSRDGVHGGGLLRAERAISTPPKLTLDPVGITSSRTLHPQWVLGHHPGSGGQATMGKSHHRNSLGARCPGRSEHIPGWLRALEIPQGELMINRVPAGGVGSGWELVACPLVVLPADTELWARSGDGRARQGPWGQLFGTSPEVMAHPQGQD